MKASKLALALAVSLVAGGAFATNPSPSCGGATEPACVDTTGGVIYTPTNPTAGQASCENCGFDVKMKIVEDCDIKCEGDAVNFGDVSPLKGIITAPSKATVKVTCGKGVKHTLALTSPADGFKLKSSSTTDKIGYTPSVASTSTSGLNTTYTFTATAVAADVANASVGSYADHVTVSVLY